MTVSTAAGRPGRAAGRSEGRSEGTVFRYVGRRLLGAIPIVLGVATIVFAVVHLAPGDPTGLLISPGVDRAVLDQIRSNLRLDDPLHVQYAAWIQSVFTGDLGYSYSRGAPVVTVIAQAFPNTLLLSGSALVVAFTMGMLIGAFQAVRQYSAADSTLSVVLLFLYSMPSFWLALMLMLVFSLMARSVWDLPVWFPVSGMTSRGFEDLSTLGRLADRLWHLALPTVSLSLALTAGIARYMRGSMLEVIRQDYVRTARSKGLPERIVILKHALRNALSPIITMAGVYIPMVFSGAVVIETVFAWPGMGRMMFDAIGARDYPLVVGGTLFFALAVVMANLLADVLYVVADPRIRYESHD